MVRSKIVKADRLATLPEILVCQEGRNQCAGSLHTHPHVEAPALFAVGQPLLELGKADALLRLGNRVAANA